MSFAYANKKHVTIPKEIETNIENNKTWVLEANYESTFSDGTRIEIKHRSMDTHPETGKKVSDHLSLLTIKF